MRASSSRDQTVIAFSTGLRLEVTSF